VFFGDLERLVDAPGAQVVDLLAVVREALAAVLAQRGRPTFCVSA
jgi:hypothetical protein